MRLIYTFIIYLFVPFVLLRLYFLGFKNPAYRLRWQERFGFIKCYEHDRPVIWLHAVSVGEVNAAKPVITKLLEQYPQFEILVTTVTPTGAYTLKQYFADDIKHHYLPYDLPFSTKRFINEVNPKVLITMETEIWPNLYNACHKKNIPLLIINARLSEKSLNGYRLVSSLMKDTLDKVNLIAAQTKYDAERFIAIGAKKEKVVVTGNLKFDVTNPQSLTEQAESLKRYFSVNRPIWIAASTQEGEEEIILKSHLVVLKKIPEAILILAPRHPERMNKVVSLCDNEKLRHVKRTDDKAFSSEDSVFILNTLGELQLHYAAAQVAFVGGSLVNTGGQNMMEPASLGIPVISGKYTYNFTEVTQLLSENNALVLVSNAEELASEICKMLSDANLRHNMGEMGQKVIEENRGNLKRLMDIIEPYLSDDETN